MCMRVCVCVCVCVCVYVCMCVCPRELKTAHKLTHQIFQFLYMALAIEMIDGCGHSNKHVMKAY